MISIGNFIEDCHNNVDESKHTGKWNVEIEVHWIIESDSPSECQQQENDNYDGIWDWMQEEEHKIEELILRSRHICVKDKPEVLEHNWRNGDPKTDLEDPLDPVVSIIFLILVKLSKHQSSKTDQERKQPAIDALSGGVILIIILNVKVKFKLGIASISICNDSLGAMP